MESPAVHIPLTSLRDVLNDLTLLTKLTNMNATVPIPIEPLLEILRSPTGFYVLFSVPAFREQMQKETHLISEMLRDRHISNNIQEYDEGLWKELWDVAIKRNTVPTSPNNNDSRESIDSQAPNILFQASSLWGEARCNVGEASLSTGTPMSVTADSEYGQAETKIGTLSIREDHSPSPAQVVLSSKSKTGIATTNVDSVVLGDSHRGVIESSSSVRTGIAISGHNNIGKGIYFTGSQEEMHSGVPKTKPVIQGRGSSTKSKTRVEAELTSHTPSTETSFNRLADDLSQEVDRFTQDIMKKSGVTSGAISARGSALYRSKKMNVELEDPNQQVLAFAESRDSKAVMCIDELNIKVSKPQPVQKTYNIEKVVGSLYVENTITSSFTDCKGNVKAMETIVGQVPEDKRRSSTKPTSGTAQT